MIQETRKKWFNFVTGQHEHIDTPKDFSDYVPQIGGRELYNLYVNYMGMEPIVAAIKVLEKAASAATDSPTEPT